MDETTPDLPPRPLAPGPTRRRVLTLVAATGAGGALIAACGGDTSTTGSGDTSTTGSGGSTPSASGSGSAGGGAGTTLVATAKVPVGGGVVLDQQKVVVTQPTEGSFKAFSAICTHQGCTVGSVKNGVISCPCHGSAYSATDGSVQNGPATRALAEVAVTVEGGQVVES